MQGRIKKARRNESQKQKTPKFWGLGGPVIASACLELSWEALPDGINYGVAVALANLFAAYGVGYIIAVTIANLVASNGISNGVAVAVTYFVAPNSIGYIVAVAVANAYIRGRATTTWGDFHRLAGAKA